LGEEGQGCRDRRGVSIRKYTVIVGEDAEVILFSPQDEHSEVIDHMRAKMVA